MQVSVNINIDQLIQIIRNLSEEEQERLMNELKKPDDTGGQSKSDFQQFLLKAPTWSDEDFAAYKEARQSFSKSRLA